MSTFDALKYYDCYFFAEDGHHLDSLRVLVGVRVFPQVNSILVSPPTCVTNESVVFSVDFDIWYLKTFIWSSIWSSIA